MRNELRVVMEEAGIGPGKLAELTGLSRQVVSQMRKGYVPSLDTAEKVVWLLASRLTLKRVDLMRRLWPDLVEVEAG